MSRHQSRLLLCSAASVALIVGALFVVEWFRIDLADTHMTIGLQDGTICVAGGTCHTVGLRGMGVYRVLAEGAFWTALLLALLVLAQSGMHVFGGAASQLATRIGYVIGSITFVCAFGAGYVFAPDRPAELAALGLGVTRTFAPALLVIGSMLGVLAVHYAQLEQVSDGGGEYKPVVVHKDALDHGRSPAAPPADSGLRARAPSESGVRARAPLESGVRTRAPSESGLRARAPSESGVRTRASSESGQRARAPSESGVRTRAPSEPGTRTRTPSRQVERGPLTGQRTKAPSQEPAVARTTSASQEVEWIPLPGRRTKAASQQPATDRTKAPSQQPLVARTSSPSQPIERVVLSGERTKSPSQPPADARTRSPSQPIERVALPGERTKAPSQPPANARTTSPSQPIERVVLPGERTKAPSQPPAVARTTSPSQQVEWIALPGHRTKSPSQPPAVARTTSPSHAGEPAVARTSSSQQSAVVRTTSPSHTGEPAVARTRSSQPAVARTTSPSHASEPAVARTTSPSHASEPAVARTTSPSHASEPAVARTSSSQPAVARTSSSQPAVARTSSSQPAVDLGATIPSRARTSSSGPIDLAARLSGAPIAVAIKPPLPEPVPVPPDQIPVAPESGLVIRKRTPSAGPLSAHQLHASDAPAPTLAPMTAQLDERIPVAPESGLVIRSKPSQHDLAAAAHDAARQAFGAPEEAPGAAEIAPRGAMPSIELHGVDPDIDSPLAPPARSQLPVQPDELPVVARAFTPPDKPAALRGKLRFAVNLATLTSLGITAQREDGTSKHVGWDDIVGIIARRLPAETPYEGTTFVDLVSTAGSTLRILPWTRLDGAPVHGAGEERARTFVQLIAARCLEARLDSWTKVFADGAGHAAQLPSAHTLAAHDDKLS